MKVNNKIVPGTKFLTLLGSLCTREHPRINKNICETKRTSSKDKIWTNDWKSEMYGAIPAKYIDWLIGLRVDLIIRRWLIWQTDVRSVQFHVAHTLWGLYGHAEHTCRPVCLLLVLVPDMTGPARDQERANIHNRPEKKTRYFGKNSTSACWSNLWVDCPQCWESAIRSYPTDQKLAPPKYSLASQILQNVFLTSRLKNIRISTTFQNFKSTRIVF